MSSVPTSVEALCQCTIKDCQLVHGQSVAVQAFELRLWPHQHPLRQFEGILAQELLFKMEDRGLWMERLQVTPP